MVSVAWRYLANEIKQHRSDAHASANRAWLTELIHERRST